MIRDEIQIHNPDAIIYEPNDLDDAIIGMSHCGKVVYSYTKLVTALQSINQWTEDESVEWVDFNIVGAHLGDYNPIILYDLLHY